jgi:hypothetical protein
MACPRILYIVAFALACGMVTSIPSFADGISGAGELSEKS